MFAPTFRYIYVFTLHLTSRVRFQRSPIQIESMVWLLLKIVITLMHWQASSFELMILLKKN